MESLGADLCLNYKADSFEKDLVQATEDFVEVFYGTLLSLACLQSHMLIKEQTMWGVGSWTLCCSE